MSRIKITRVQVFSRTPEKSKSSTVMKYFFTIIQIISGFDLGFIKHKMFERTTRKSILFIYALSFITILLINLYNAFIILGFSTFTTNYYWVLIYLIHYVFTFLCFLFMRTDKTFFQLHRDLESIDLMLKIRGESYKVEIKLLIAAGLVLIAGLIIGIISCAWDLVPCSKHPLLTILIDAMYIILDFVHVVCASIFFAFYFRLRSLKAILSTDRANYALNRRIYKSIADSIETYKSEFDLLILTSIVFKTIELMIMMIAIVFGAYDGLNVWIVMFTLGMEVSMDLMKMFSVAICAGMVTRQVDGILIILHDKLLIEREENRIRELQQLITYVSARRLKFRLYQVLPLDANLIGLVFNFCVTYLIVIVQFRFK